MKKNLVLSCISIASLFVSCKENSNKTEELLPEIPTEANAADTAAEKEHYCFRNETPYTNEDGSHLVDVENLEFTVEGDSVKGKFEWIPGEKGGLSGEISGTKKGNEIEAVYNETYAEEHYPISLKISLSPNEAVVTSSDESFGSYTIKKSDCK